MLRQTMLTPTKSTGLAVSVIGLIATLIVSPAGAQETRDWYEFESTAPTEPGVFGMEGWLESPAGKHGRIRVDGGQLVYDGDPIRLWGINNTFDDCAPRNDLAERRAEFYAKYGINSVRLHKYGDGSGWAGILGGDSFTTFNAQKLDRMDYYIAQLKRRGIYVKLSQSFGPPKLGPGDLDEVPFLEEFGEFGDNNRIEIPHSGIFYSPAIQDVHIQQMVKLLKHENPYTGMTYAEDPAIWDLEIVNEQSILFYTSSSALEQSPTLRKRVGRRFCDWLEDKYGSHEKLVDAWGERALNSFDLAQNEHLAKDNILPLGNPNYWKPESLEGSESYRKQRLLDTLEFLTGLQLDFYERFVEAVREAGYEGEISGSNWKAGQAYSHFANLWTDAQVGTIDRHNYFGEGLGSMLPEAGSGMLSSGMQQVAGRPFMLSEWIHVWPNEWGAEGPAIIGAYGLGLQGWDVSYMFQNADRGRISRRLGGQDWDVTAPQVIGLFPAVARQVHRGDVDAAEKAADLNVHAPSLFEGAGLDFADRSAAKGYDRKSFQSSKVPQRALAAARVRVNYTDKPKPTPRFDMDEYKRGGAIVSATGQLRWHEAKKADAKRGGYIVIDTPGTQALVGFADGSTAETADAAITARSPFGAIYLTALDRDAGIGGGDRLLVTAIARARNTGQEYNDAYTELKAKGEAPVLMEPVRATIELRRSGSPTVHRLDHDGQKTGETIPVNNGTVKIDTGRDKTPYYLIEY